MGGGGGETTHFLVIKAKIFTSTQMSYKDLRSTAQDGNADELLNLMTQ